MAYTEDIQDTIGTFPLQFHLYADDTQLMAHMPLAEVNQFRCALEQCVEAVQEWCSRRRLRLNPDKTELIWFGSRANLRKLQSVDTSLHLGSVNIAATDCVRDLGVWLDSDLSMRTHISKLTATCFFHLRRLRKLRRVLSVDLRKRLASVFILSRIDYCNSSLAELPASSLAPLKRVINATARYVTDIGPHDHLTSVMRSLHWLPISQRVTYKLCALMHASTYGNAPAYISELVTPVSSLSGRATLRSASSGLYDVPKTKSSFGDRAFSIAGPRAWNSLPTDLRHTESWASFKRLLKTELFRRAYP